MKPWLEYIDPINWHEAALIFPLMADEEIQKLADDIKANGLKNSIVLLNDKVLDGRNRMLACKLAGVSPDFQSRNAEKLGSPVSWVLSQNLHRRQLTASQRSVIGMEAEKLFAIEAQEREHARKTQSTVAFVPESPKGNSRDRAAKESNVSPRYIQDAKLVAAKSPELLAKVKSGEISLPKAKKATVQGAPKSYCSITSKNVKDARCLSMAQHRLHYCQAKTQVLFAVMDEASFDIKTRDAARSVLQTYLRCFQDFAKFTADAVEFIEKNIAARREVAA